MQDTRYKMYNTTNGGLRQHTLAAVVAAVEQALAELAPGRLVLSQGELHDASVNRSPQAFERNPTAATPTASTRRRPCSAWSARAGSSAS